MKKFFKEGEVYFTNFSGAVGVEQKGKGKENLRPIVILKKYNKNMFLGLPCSTSNKKNKYYLSIGKINGKENFVILSQLRVFDASRLQYKIGRISIQKNILIIKSLQQALETLVQSLSGKF